MFVVALALGIAFAAYGGERFVRGAVGLSIALRIPAGIIGATIAAFATSAPELAVSVFAAVEDDSAIALGNAVGSDLANLGLVLGIAAVMVPVVARWGDLRRDLPMALVAVVLVGMLGVDGTISRLDAAVLLVVFAGWITWAALDARRERSALPEAVGDASAGRAGVDALIGLVLLVISGQLVVSGAQGLGDALGLDQFVVGAVFVALGTSTPELATTIVAVRRGHAEVGVGALLGSNLFNTLFVVGVAGAIQPIDVEWGEVSLTLGFVLVATLASIPDRRAVLGRARGVLLLGIYAAYVVALLVTR